LERPALKGIIQRRLCRCLMTTRTGIITKRQRPQPYKHRVYQSAQAITPNASPRSTPAGVALPRMRSAQLTDRCLDLRVPRKAPTPRSNSSNDSCTAVPARPSSGGESCSPHRPNLHHRISARAVNRTGLPRPGVRLEIHVGKWRLSRTVGASGVGNVA
jgi:hypothetical protein